MTPSKHNLVFAFFLFFFTLSLGIVQAQGRWTQAAPMPEERSEVAAASLNGKIYVAGGFGVTQILWEYDIGANRWHKRAPLPLPLHHTGVASVGGKLYVIGGYSGHEWSPVGNVFAYDPVGDRWQERAMMPTAHPTAHTRVRSPAVPFGLQDATGTLHRLDHYAGHWLLLVFHRHLR